MQEIYLKRRQERMQGKEYTDESLKPHATNRPSSTSYQVGSSSEYEKSVNSKSGESITNDRLLWAKFEKEWACVTTDA
jgi:hypothetical protein